MSKRENYIIILRYMIYDRSFINDILLILNIIYIRVTFRFILSSHIRA